MAKLTARFDLEDRITRKLKPITGRLERLRKTSDRTLVIKAADMATRTIRRVTRLADRMLGRPIGLVIRAMDFVTRPLRRINTYLKSRFPRAHNIVVRAVDLATNTIRRISAMAARMLIRSFLLTVRLIDLATRGLARIGSYAEAITSKGYRITVRVFDLATRPLRAIGRLATSTFALLGIGGGIYGGVVAPLQMVMERQGTTTAFEVMLGDAEKASKRINELTDFAGRTPFARDEIYKASRLLQTFTGNALSTGEGLELIGDVAAGTQHGLEETAIWFGRLYDGMKSGRPIGDATARLQEMGAISGEARARLEKLAESGKDISVIWPEATKEFSKYNGMMKKMSNNLQNLLLGTKQFFVQNIFMRWGQGVADGLSKALNAFRDWRSANAVNIARMGDEFEKLGTQVTEKFFSGLNPLFSFMSDQFRILFPGIDDEMAELAVKMGDRDLLDTIGEIRRLERMPFEARLNLVVENGKEWFSHWWEKSGEPGLLSATGLVADTYGNFIRGAILSVLGEEETENTFVNSGMQAGKTFIDSFIEALDPFDIAKRIGKKLIEINWNAATSPSAENFSKALIANIITYAVGVKLFKLLGVGKLFKGIRWLFGKFTGFGKGPKGPKGPFGPFGGQGPKPPGGGGPPRSSGGSRPPGGGPPPPPSGPLNPGRPPFTPPPILDRYGNPLRSIKPPPPPKKQSWLKRLNPFKRINPSSGFMAGHPANGMGGFFSSRPMRLLGKVARPLAIATDIAAISTAKESERPGVIGGAAGGWGGFLGGSAAGAAIGSVVPGLGTAIGGIVGGILGALGGSALGETIGNWFSDNWESIKQGAAAAGEWISDRFSQAKSWVSETWESFSGWFDRTVWTPVSDAAINTINFFVGLWDIGKENLQRIWGTVSDWFNETVWEPVTTAAEIVGKWLYEKFGEAKDWVIEKWSMVSEWFFRNVWSPITEAVGTTAQWIGDKYTVAKEWIMETWGSISGWFDETVWSPTIERVGIVGEWIAERYTVAKDWVIEIWEAVSGWFEETVWGPVKEGVEAVGSRISGAFQAAWEVVEPIWSSIVSAWETVKGWGDTVKSWGGNVVTFVQRVINRGESITGMKSSTAYADGGIISRPHLGLVGEAGPEAIIPLSADRRSRALSLYEQTGRMLGVRPYAAGGIIGGSTVSGNEPSNLPDSHVAAATQSGQNRSSKSFRDIVVQITGDHHYSDEMDAVKVAKIAVKAIKDVLEEEQFTGGEAAVDA